MAWVLVQCNVYSAELEVKYIEKLLLSSQMIGEGGYYLTTLEGAVHVLKNYKSSIEVRGEKTTFNVPDTVYNIVFCFINLVFNINCLITIVELRSI